MDAINKFIQWNASSLKGNIFYDKMMVEALLLVFSSPEQIAEKCISDDVRDFISCFLKNRTEDDPERMEKMEEYIQSICNSRSSSGAIPATTNNS